MTESELLSKYKQCSKCEIYKPFTSFHKRKSSKDGLTGMCSSCENARTIARETRSKKDPEWYKKYLEGKRYHNNQLRSRDGHVEYRNPSQLKAYQSSYSSIFPEKVNAHSNFQYHLKRGNITRMPCQICGSKKVEAHHEDYSKPLEVIWLCIKHHKEIHRKFNTIRERLGIPEHDRKL